MAYFFSGIENSYVLEDLIDIHYRAHGANLQREFTVSRDVRLSSAEYLRFLRNLNKPVSFLRSEDVGYNNVVHVSLKGSDDPGILVVSDGTCKVCEVSYLEL